MFWKSRRKARELNQQVKMEESQRVLLSAATQTANAARAVTTLLKARLDDSLKQFEYTARIINDGLFVCDLDGMIRASNPAARHMFAERSLVGTSILDLFDLGGERIGDAQALWDLIARSNRWSHHDPKPLRGRKPECSTLMWIEPTCATLNWSDGTASMIVIVRHVGPVFALRESAREAKGRFQAAFDIAFDGMMVVQEDRIVAANSAVGALFGYTTAQLLNRPLTDLFVTADHGAVAAEIENSNFSVHGQHASGALRSILFSGTSVMWLSSHARLITLKDVTGLNDRDMMQPRGDNGIDMVCCFDPEYRIRFVNEAFARQCGVDRGTLIGCDVRDFLGCQPRHAFEESVGGLTIAAPVTRTQVAEVEVTRDWIDHAIFNETGRAIEFQRVGRDLPLAR